MTSNYIKSVEVVDKAALTKEMVDKAISCVEIGRYFIIYDRDEIKTETTAKQLTEFGYLEAHGGNKNRTYSKKQYSANRMFTFIRIFVCDIGVLCPNNKKKTMQVHNSILIAECSTYDFKEILERKKVKSWLKSVSAFANTDGGSLFYGVNDDGLIVGLDNPQADADFISEMIKARLDPVPEVQLIPIEHEGHTLLEVKVKAGTLTPYYYYQDGTRTAYVRVGNESVECNSQQLLSLVLKGTHMTWDSLPTQVDASKHSFIILANTFREQTHQEWNDKYLESFGLVTPDGKLTNAGLLFVDNCTVFQSRIFCTRWTGLYKDDAISSVEHRANLVLLLKYGMDFIKNYTMSGWVKMPNYRLNLPDYSDRAIFEGLVNHLIHRDYTVMGGEVHIDIYDDRVELVSPGAMLDGTQIQDRDIYKVPSMRRNPVIADMFTQLDYMEKRGSGLRKMRELTEKLPNFLQGKEPQYQTEATSFYTTFYNLNWSENGRIPVEKVANRVNSTLEKYHVNEESSVEKFGVNAEKFGVNEKGSVKKFGVNANRFGDTSKTPKKVSKTAQKIIDLVISDPSITADNMANKIGVTKRAIEKNIKSLRDMEILAHEGSDKAGYWRIIVKPTVGGIKFL